MVRINLVKAGVNLAVGVADQYVGALDAKKTATEAKWQTWFRIAIPAAGYGMVMLDKMPEIGDALAQSGTTLLGQMIASMLKLGGVSQLGTTVQTARASFAPVRNYSNLAVKEDMAAHGQVGRYPAPETKKQATAFPRLE